MAKFKFTQKAIEDLTGIWEYTVENWSAKLADKYYKLIIDAYLELANNPALGKAYSQILESTPQSILCFTGKLMPLQLK